MLRLSPDVVGSAIRVPEQDHDRYERQRQEHACCNGSTGQYALEDRACVAGEVR